MLADQNSTVIAEEQEPVRVERMAWGVILVSFALFCLTCAGSTLGVYAFFFQSTVPLQRVLAVGQGTAGVTSVDLLERVVREQVLVVSTGSTIRTDPQSQAVLSFYGPQSAEPVSDNEQPLIASVTLKGDTSVNLRTASAPRFDWSSGYHDIQIRDFSGAISILVTDAVDDFLLRVSTPQGVVVHISGMGRYDLDASETQVRLTNRLGEAFIFSEDFADSRSIPAGQQGVIYAGRPDIVVSPSRDNIVENGLFVFAATDFMNADERHDANMMLPTRWGCTNLQDDQPRGRYEIGSWAGRMGLRLVRDNSASSHGETHCVQLLGAGGVSVGDYSFLELSATFSINYQSLSECGVAGSECPMMLLMEYTDVNGIRRQWYQGFYYADDPQVDYPLRCSSCTQDHRQVNANVWYTFDTGNLFTLVQPEQRPRIIERIEFYASGHQYDVVVGEVALLAGLTDTIPPELLGVGNEMAPETTPVPAP